MSSVPLPDVNVLLALVAEQHEHHAAAHRWFSAVSAWATAPVTESGLVRLMLNPAVVGGQLRGADALEILRRLRAQKRHRFFTDGSTLADPAIDVSALVGHRQVTDLHLVELAASKGATLHTFDARLPAALAPADRRHVALVPLG